MKTETIIERFFSKKNIQYNYRNNSKLGLLIYRNEFLLLKSGMINRNSYRINLTELVKLKGNS